MNLPKYSSVPYYSRGLEFDVCTLLDLVLNGKSSFSFVTRIHCLKLSIPYLFSELDKTEYLTVMVTNSLYLKLKIFGTVLSFLLGFFKSISLL